jgi:hypothetical protein
MDYRVEGSDYLLSYNKICGRKVKDIQGYITNEFDEPVFKLCYIQFEDGTIQGVEGEHDLPYLIDYDEDTADTLYNIWEEECDREEEEV